MTREFAFPSRGALERPARGKVHLWLVGEAETDPAPELVRILSPEEEERALRFRVIDSRARYLNARIGLRRLLAAYLDIPEREIPIEIGREGKPTLSGRIGEGISFNLSHSGGWVLLGFAWGAPLGVDLEGMRPFPDLMGVAGRVMTPDEVAALATLPGQERETAFFRGWTRKEALLKARGTGIWDQPAHLAAGLGAERVESQHLLVHEKTSGRAWSVLGFDAPSGYAGAAAIESESATIDFVHQVRRL